MTAVIVAFALGLVTGVVLLLVAEFYGFRSAGPKG